MRLVRLVGVCFAVCLLAIVGMLGFKRQGSGLSWISFGQAQGLGYELMLMDAERHHVKRIASYIVLEDSYPLHIGAVAPQWSPTAPNLMYLEDPIFASGNACIFELITERTKCISTSQLPQQHRLGLFGFVWSP